MKYALRHWFTFGAVVAAAALLLLLCGPSSMGPLQRMLLGNFIIQLMLQYEEYGWFGRELVVEDMVLRSSAELPPPPQPAIIFNLSVAYGFYLAPVLFPDVIWLGLAPVLFGFMRFAIPIAMKRKLRAVYPLGRTVLMLGHVSIGVLYLYYIHANHLATIWDWALAVLCALGWQYAAFVRVICEWLTDKNSPYPFSDDWNA